MVRLFSRILLLVTGLISSVLAFAQDSLQKEKPQMAELMRSNGKIYVVVAVLVIILLGLFFYVINLDRKITRIERNDG